MIQKILNSVFKHFGHTPPVVYCSPVKDRYVTSPFGPRKLSGIQSGFHYGVDYAGTTNKLACAPCDCKIIKVLQPDYKYPYKFVYNGSWQRQSVPHGRAWTPFVVLEPLHDSSLKFVYRHGDHKEKEGDIVKGGEYFYKIGNYGNSKGAHLHFEVIKNDKNIDPEKWLNEVKAYVK